MAVGLNPINYRSRSVPICSSVRGSCLTAEEAFSAMPKTMNTPVRTKGMAVRKIWKMTRIVRRGEVAIHESSSHLIEATPISRVWAAHVGRASTGK